MKKSVFFFILLVIPFIVAQTPCEEGEKRSCNSFGICADGLQICINGLWSACSITQKETDICGNGLDDNCDGIIDENCLCEEGAIEECGSNVGICQKGLKECVNGDWTECLLSIDPQIEFCSNGLDDDCDGFCDSSSSFCIDQTIPGDEDCNLNTCSNRIQDGNEIGIDCGGICGPCVSCNDGILNQGEEKVKQILADGAISDCGGSNCPSCPTCFDGIKNQNEEKTDCGGVCNPCFIQQEQQFENPLCGNGICDRDEGETTLDCPQDCDTGISLILILFFLMIGCIFIGLSIFIFLKFSTKKQLKKKEPKPIKIHSSLLKEIQPKKQARDKLEEELKKKIR